MVGNDYTDKLICWGTATQRERARGEVTVMTSISFYLANRRRVFAIHVIKSRVGKLTKNFGASRRIFSKSLPPLA